MKTKVNIRLLHLYVGESGAANDCFLKNICSEKQILPRMFYYLSTAKYVTRSRMQ